ncbi:hypothetical protein CDAR_501211 [Caerostris darwini]|uniref:Dirigent protein n=1 Tax=Caerostris darwini TaxID=1538125 RepID=A0AAV4NP08_9ARAC|nr:hypothetical protein CDAR_501211 [Caerostris darwini]
MELRYLSVGRQSLPFSAGDVSLVSAEVEVSTFGMNGDGIFKGDVSLVSAEVEVSTFGMDGDGIFKGVFSGSSERDKTLKSEQTTLRFCSIYVEI